MSWRAFEEIAQAYDEWYEQNKDIYLAELACLLDTMGGEKKGLCLEVGVGTGRFSYPLDIDTGLDAAFSPLLLAKERGIEVVQGKAEYLPFRDSSFSCVLMIVTLCFLEDREKALSEVARVLKRRGRLYICSIPADSPLGQRYAEKGKKPSSIYSYARFLSRDELFHLLHENKFLLTRECHTLIENGVPNFLCIEAIYLGT
ncbi:MAG: SAM-dependent methyltransferase [Thermoproteota archaeon]|nr:MAG: SAM-dependent methyltransferase [Candidatus Korarchaeota archaeon]